MPINPEAEFMLRMEALRREIDARARVSVLQIVAALVIAFAAGVLVGRGLEVRGRAPRTGAGPGLGGRPLCPGLRKREGRQRSPVARETPTVTTVRPDRRHRAAVGGDN